MSTKDWLTIGALMAIIANPIILVILLILGAIVFIVGYVTIVVFGLVSAIIYGLFGLGVVWLIGVFNRKFLEKHWQIILIVPALFFLGLVVDRIPGLAMMSVMSGINADVGFGSMDYIGDECMLTVGPYLVAVFALAVAVAVLSITVVRMKRRYWWVK